jgi:hypothetical protein
MIMGDSFRIDWDWITPSEDEGLAGPEIPTFGSLQIWIGEVCITTCCVRPLSSEVRNHVIGPLSGLAEWIVDNWMEVLWQSHTPFTKSLLAKKDIPDYSEILEGEYPSVDPSSYGRWFSHHCFGHAVSDIALPNILFIPEDAVVGIAVLAPPDLGSKTKFTNADHKDVAWINKEDLSSHLEIFVRDVIAKAEAEAPSNRWALWMRSRLEESLQRSREPTERRKWMLGDVVANSWKRIVDELGNNSKALEGVLLDSILVDSDEELSRLSKEVMRLAAEKSTDFLWKRVETLHGEYMLPPFERGYRRAERVRDILRLGDSPIDFRDILEDLGIALRRDMGSALYQTAYIVVESSAAEISLCTSHPKSQWLMPQRFSIAAALGGIFANRIQTKAYGGATSSQARWILSQESNAFAAMLLLPSEAIDSGLGIDELVEKYGIAKSAATWHMRNIHRRRAQDKATAV